MKSKKGRLIGRVLRAGLLVLMVGTLLVFCGIDHALASSYNARGDLVSLASSSSGPQTFTYDTLRRLVSSTDATGYQVQYAYDAGSSLDSSTTATTRGCLTARVATLLRWRSYLPHGMIPAARH